MKQPKMEAFKGQIVDNLPPDVAQELGNIVARWAYVEQLLKQLVFTLVGINDIWGRVVIRTDRADGHITMVEDLLTLSGKRIESDPTPTQFKVSLGKLERTRDMLVHGTWISDEQSRLRVISIGGKWNLGPKQPRVTRRMFPNAPVVTKDSLVEVRTGIEEAIKSILMLHDHALNVTQSWQGKHPSQAQLGHPTDDQTQSKPQDPQEPSRD